ncbi:MAG TPA: hypothetical protein ENL03_01825, partial [Phycisphaerae bacterium]|nr:hypothetical protein [Phycisphaerae bacterium]
MRGAISVLQVVVCLVVGLGLCQTLLGGQEYLSQKPREPLGPILRRTYGFVPDDPYFYPSGGGWPNTVGQWHLNGSLGFDLNVTSAWENGYTGSGVVIGIVDDSLETTHPDLAKNYLAECSWDFRDNDSLPDPEGSNDRHGVSVAGVAAGRGGNGVGVTGVAPFAHLAGLRVSFESDQMLSMFYNAAMYRNDIIRVKNHSYGITAGYIGTTSERQANRLSAGEGVINVWAAGNEATNANVKMLPADRASLTVTALGSNGKLASYSNIGACVFVTAPSSSSGGYGITTTDRTGNNGYNVEYDSFTDTGYTTVFGGTSSAAPAISGVVAMILQANPDLDIRGVKHVLAATSKIVDESSSSWQQNAAGYFFSPKYGFGLADASAAVAMAENYAGPGEQIVITPGKVNVNQALADDDAEGVTCIFDVQGPGLLETVEIEVLINHTYWGDLDIDLISPAGTTSKLAYGSSFGSGFSQKGWMNWTFTSNAFWGEDATGLWEINV